MIYYAEMKIKETEQSRAQLQKIKTTNMILNIERFQQQQILFNCEAVGKFIYELENIIADENPMPEQAQNTDGTAVWGLLLQKITAVDEKTQKNEENQECHWAVLS